MAPWIGQLADGAMGLRHADPTATALDSFQCGETKYAIEVADYFRSRAWFNATKNRASPATYEVSTTDHVVGYLAAAHGNRPHPSNRSDNKARYMIVFVAGLHLRFHGKVNPRSPTGERYSDGLFRLAEEVLAPIRDDCVGLFLRVREANAPAIAFYDRFGFEVDSAASNDGHLYMRKLF